MRRAVLLSVALAFVAGQGAAAGDRRWENPVFHSQVEAVAEARQMAGKTGAESSRAQKLFIDLTLGPGHWGGGRRAVSVEREVVGDLLLTHPSSFLTNPAQRITVERFTAAAGRQQRVLEDRLARFGFPGLEGLTYCRLVGSVDAFAGLGPASSDKMSQVGGVTYFCRYVVLPLSYVGTAAVNELRRNPSVDFDGTIQAWEAKSYASLVSTFRHEMVHVHTNSALGVPRYSDRRAFPTWFHEGTATYLSADPHSGLSERYREYQDFFFYLVQRYGVADLQAFYSSVLGGSSVTAALEDVYAIAGRSELARRSARWHRARDRAKTVLWIVAAAVVIAAFRGSRRPTIAYLLFLASAALALAIATGLAEHVCGLWGPTVVLLAKAGFGLIAAALAAAGLRRVRRHRRAV